MMLQVEDLAVARGGLRVLEGLSFGVEAGRCLTLRGPNGSGKTTLLRCLAGLQEASAGQIHAPEDGCVYAAHSDGIKQTLSLRENLMFWADVYGAGSIDPALEAFDLMRLQHRPAGALSAGQKRRLGLARLVLTQRPVWLLDEPTVSLDQKAVGQFADAVRAHLGRGGCAVIATHIDLGLEAEVLDVSGFKASATPVLEAGLEAFL